MCVPYDENLLERVRMQKYRMCRRRKRIGRTTHDALRSSAHPIALPNFSSRMTDLPSHCLKSSAMSLTKTGKTIKLTAAFNLRISPC
jgi:hypothetical protein